MSARDDLMKRRDQLIAEAKGFAETAKKDGRDFLKADEQSEISTRLTEVKSLNETLAADAKSASILGQLDAMAAGDGDITPGGGPFEAAKGVKQYLSFSKGWSDNLADKTQLYGEKAIAAGSAVFVDPELTTTPIPIGRPATALLDVLPVTPHGQPAYSYLRQSVRTNNAAVLAEGATKPTSVYTIVKVDNALSIIAHLSEALPSYWLRDRSELQQFLSTEMTYGLQLAIESKVLADINGTSGIQLQAYDTSKLVTIRKSLTKVEMNGYNPSAIVVHPLDWQEIELQLVTAGAVELNGLPYDAPTRRLWGTPVVVANIEAAGVSHILADGAVGIDTDTHGVLMKWSEESNATDFAENKVRARMECRTGTSVYRPVGVVKATLASA